MSIIMSDYLGGYSTRQIDHLKYLDIVSKFPIKKTLLILNLDKKLDIVSKQVNWEGYSGCGRF